MFISPEEALKNLVDRYGERIVAQAFNSVIREYAPFVTENSNACYTTTDDAELDRMVNILHILWSTGDVRLKNWASVQFERAIPEDMIEDALKKTKGNCP
jgi:hypothetical protein